MKYSNSSFLVLLALCSIFLTACDRKFNFSYTQENEEISIENTQLLVNLENKFIGSINDKNYQALASLFHKQQDISVLTNLIESILLGAKPNTFSSEFRILSQRYFGTNLNSILMANDFNDSIVYATSHKESDAALLGITFDQDSEQKLVTVLLTMVGDEWKIDKFTVWDYKFNGLTAVGYIEKAEQSSIEGRNYQALQEIMIASSLMKISNFAQYVHQEKMKQTIELLKNELAIKTGFNKQYKVGPMTFFHLKNGRFKNGYSYFDWVYETSTDVDDGAAIEAEVKEFSEQIYEIMPDLEEEISYLYVHAVNPLPEGSTQKERQGYRTMMIEKHQKVF